MVLVLQSQFLLLNTDFFRHGLRMTEYFLKSVTSKHILEGLRSASDC